MGELKPFGAGCSVRFLRKGTCKGRPRVWTTRHRLLSMRCVRFCGVVPYAVDGADGSVHLLLAREAFGKDKNMWSAFAGRVDACEDASVPEAIAARECHEESMGILGSVAELTGALRAKARRLDVHSGIHFLLPLVFDQSMPGRFAAERERALRGKPPSTYTPFLEKDQLCWVPMDGLKARGLRYRRGFWQDLHTICARVSECVRGAAPPNPPTPSRIPPPRAPPLPPLPTYPDPYA